MSTAWRRKFAVAFRGIRTGVRGQASFRVHLVAAAAVVASAIVLRMHAWQWAVLLLCIAAVLVAELFNSALEFLARAITEERNTYIGEALDIAAGAVLTAAIGAAVVGISVLLHRAGELAGWWSK
jgi:diacylglycerol kinase